MSDTTLKVDSHRAKVRNFHDDDADSYQGNRYHQRSCEGLSYLTRRELVLNAVDIDSGTILDLGCGPGILTQHLLRENRQVFRADLSLEMLKQARAKVPGASDRGKAHFFSSDATEICCRTGCMQLVLCVGVVCYLENPLALLDEIHRVLKPGGQLIIQVDHMMFPGLHKKLVPCYRSLKSGLTSKRYDKLDFNFNYIKSAQFLRNLEARGFQVASIDYFDFRIPFIDLLLTRFSLVLGKFMYRRRNFLPFRCFSHGMIIKAERT